MILSVIIVNYRVTWFLELCLHSVTKALHGLDAEIIVVDNNSADGGIDLLRPLFPPSPLFPPIKWIVNKENIGFARANNQAISQSSGQYILFLNPDTVVPEDFAHKCLNVIIPPARQPSDPLELIGWPGVEAIGVRMIDGSGHFLKESQRGLPTPWVAFCKLSGLTALFPRSRRFAQYYLGHLPAGESHDAPVLSGACLLVSRAALEQIGAFDETFFLYAEDIDLSYRLLKAGHANYYFADTSIIHFKGESTQKDIRYVRQFYKAMIQFRRKHFNTGLPGLFRIGMESVIWLRAGLAALKPSQAAPPGPARRTWLAGDPTAIDQLRPKLAKINRIPAPTEKDAEEIIYCIGQEFSFKSAIRALETLAETPAQGKTPARTAAFYAAGSHAIVSSTRRDNRGETWIL